MYIRQRFVQMIFITITCNLQMLQILISFSPLVTESHVNNESTPGMQPMQQSPYTTRGPPQPEQITESPSTSHSHVVKNSNNKPWKAGDLFAQAQVFNRKK